MINEISYSVQEATSDEIFAHLLTCNESFIPPLHERVDLRSYAKKIAESSITFEAWSRRSLIGLLAAYFNDAENQIGFITNVSVVTEQKGKGVASNLLVECISYGTLKGFKLIKLEVDKTNSPAFSLYKKAGFVPEGDIGDKACTMVKSLLTFTEIIKIKST